MASGMSDPVPSISVSPAATVVIRGANDNARSGDGCVTDVGVALPSVERDVSTHLDEVQPAELVRLVKALAGRVAKEGYRRAIAAHELDIASVRES